MTGLIGYGLQLAVMILTVFLQWRSDSAAKDQQFVLDQEKFHAIVQEAITRLRQATQAETDQAGDEWDQSDHKKP